ncbi:hypothetical protein DFS34DRAFT_665616 [Phlyctochytrium arcticum]|nr:hypothetical protein DFS34DRAFT_665616 [Phlyctochytrium arcticum]
MIALEEASVVDTTAKAAELPALPFQQHFTNIDQPTTACKPPPGTRPTQFTSLIAVSTKSRQAALTRDAHLQAALAATPLRISPPHVRFTDYMHGKERSATVTLTNLTKRVQRIAIHAPSTKVFTARYASAPGGGSSSVTPELGEWTAIAPGLEVTLQVTFYPPALKTHRRRSAGGSRDSKADADSSLAYTDRLRVLVEGKNELRVGLEAYPAGGVLEVEPEVDFGVVVMVPEQVAGQAMQKKPTGEVNSNGWGSNQLKDEQNDIRYPQWMTRSVRVRNTGPRKAKFTCHWDKSLPIRVYPDSAVLPAAHESMDASTIIHIAYLPVATGTYHHTISLELDNPSPYAPHKAPTPQTIAVKVAVIEHTLRLRNAANTYTLDPQKMDFGAVYYQQKARVSARLENRSGGTVRWVITHAGQSKPMVPSRAILDSGGSRQNENSETTGSEPHTLVAGDSLSDLASTTPEIDIPVPDADANLRASMSVFPSEGTLAPYTSVPVTFTFFPELPHPTRGFKATGDTMHPPARTYRVPMDLKVVSHQSEDGLVHEDDHIDISLVGRACAVRAAIEPRELSFPSVPQNHYYPLETTLVNKSPYLGFRFKFERLAHFQTEPSTGWVGPGEDIPIKVAFRPHQLGVFHSKLVCAIESSPVPALTEDEEDPTVTKLAKLSTPSTTITQVTLKLNGVCDATKLDSAQTGFRSYATPYRHHHHGPATTTDPSMGSLSRLTDMNGDAQTDLADCGTIAGYPATQENASSFASIRVKGGHRPPAPPIQPHNRHDHTNGQTNPEWNAKSQHRARCLQDLRDGREQRVRKIRERCLGNDGVEMDWVHCTSGDEELRKIDRENGLVAPEPTDFKFEETTRKKAGGSSLLAPSGDVNTSSRKQADPRKLRMLLHKLLEVSPLHPKTTGTTKGSPPAPALTQATKGASQLSLSDIPATVLDTPLSAEALANIFTAHAVLDLGKVTVHSMNVIPLNFLNATPGNNPIHITISEGGGRDGRAGAPSEAINVTPKHMIIPQMSIAGFTVQVCLHTPGLVERQITYLVNGRYKYSVPVCVEVVPVSLDLAETRVEVAVQVGKDSGGDEGSGGPSSTPKRRSSAEAAQVPSAELSSMVPRAEKTVIIENNGNYQANYEWIFPGHESAPRTGTTPANDMALEGRFSLDPPSGIIPANSTAKARITFTPGIKPTHEEAFTLNVFDPHDKAKNVTKSMTLSCVGAIPAAHCVLVSPSAKQGPLDLGILSVVHPDTAYAHLHVLYPDVFSATGAIPSSPTGIPSPTTGTAPTTAAGSGAPTTPHARPDPSKGLSYVRIKNTSLNPAAFSATTQLSSVDSEVRLYPAQGILAPSSTIDIVVQVIPTRAGLVEDTILISAIGSGRVLRVPIRYDARTVDVTVDVQGGDLMKGTIMGSTGFKRLICTNKSGLPAGVVVDFRAYPEFELKVRDPPAVSRKSSAVPRGRSASGRHRRARDPPDIAARQAHLVKSLGPGHPLYSKLESIEVTPPQQPKGRHSALAKSASIAAPTGSVFLVRLPANECINLDLIFRPSAVRKHFFEFPVFIFGCETISKVRVEAEGLPSPLHTSKTALNFKNRVVHRDQGPNSVSHLRQSAKETITLVNTSKKTLEWWFDLDSLEEGDKMFRVEPWRGQLTPGDSATVTVAFQPETTGLFEASVPLYLDCLAPKALLSIALQGTGVEPSLAMDPPELFLPITPPGIETTAIFSIVNHGCERTEVREIIPDELKGHLELFFPEGKLLKSDGEKLTVVARFLARPKGSDPTIVIPSNVIPNAGAAASHTASESDSSSSPPLAGTAISPGAATVPSPSSALSVMQPAPASFTAKLEFSNDGRRAFYLPVHGTSEGSLLTLQTYRWLSSNEKKAVESLSENQKRNRILAGTRPFRTPSGIPLEGGPSLQSIDDFLTRTGATLMWWLQDHVNVSQPWLNFPEQVTSGRGRPLMELVQSVSGRKPAQNYSSPAGTSPEEQARWLYKEYTQILVQLTASGALLSSVKPEFLMSIEEYRTLVQFKVDQMKSDLGASLHDEFHEYTNKVTEHFALISTEAWVTVLLQIVRVYICSPITPRQLRSLPGVGRDEMDLVWQKSLKVGESFPEDVLLRWVAYHSWKCTGSSVPFSSFTNDFKSCLPFANIILSHLPNMQTSHFGALVLDAAAPEDVDTNLSLISGALADLLPFSPAQHSALSLIAGPTSSGLDAFLLTLFMYQTLPSFIPREQIEFQGALHECVRRTIELINPTLRPICYLPDLQGSADFSVPSSQIIVPPKQSLMATIEFASKFYRQVEGSLVLRSKKMGLNSASVMVYELKSVVKEAGPKKVIKAEGVMYATPPSVVDVEVTNPFNESGTFSIDLQHTKTASHEGHPLPFRSNSETISLGSSESRILHLSFLPFELGLHTCTLHFISPTVGEFTYEVVGKGLAPPPLENLLWTSKAGDPLEKAIRLSPINPAKEKALLWVLGSKTKIAAGKAKGKKKDKQQEDRRDERGSIDILASPKKPMRYKVEYSSTYFHGPAEIVVKPHQDLGKESKNIISLEQNYTELPVTFKPNSPGKYSCRITLTCLDSSDLRILIVNGLAISEGSRAALEFMVPARQTVMQDIPIINRTADDWSLKANIQGGGKEFNGPPTLTARAFCTTSYPITFVPARAETIHAQLTLSNLNTAQKHVYHLRGVGLEPLPEGRVDIDCRARDVVLQKFNVPNFGDSDADFDVTTDVPFSSGAASIKVGAGQTGEYELRVLARASGKHNATVAFTNRADETFVWYVVALSIQSPPPESTLEIITTVRQPATVDIPTINPLDHPVTFSVKLSGNGLAGDKTITLQAREELTYQLSFEPMLRMKTSGSIKFHSEEIGEFWYQLRLEAVDAPPVTLSSMSCALGKCCFNLLPLINPLSKPIHLSLSLANSRDFGLLYPPSPILDVNKASTQRYLELDLAAHEQMQVQLVYWPRSLTQRQKGSVEVVSKEIGNFVFFVEGCGELPTPFPPHIVNSPLQDPTSSSLTFTNPLVDPIPITIALQQSADHPDFSLIHRHKRMHVNACASIEIPLVYCPQDMIGRDARVIVTMEGGNLEWVFPIQGVPEKIIAISPPIHVEARARDGVEKEFEVLLPGFPVMNQSRLPGLTCTLTPVKTNVLMNDDDPALTEGQKDLALIIDNVRRTDDGMLVRVKARYTPQRPINTTYTLTLIPSDPPSRYNLPLTLTSHPPSLDDTITIEGILNKLSCVSFTITSRVSYDRPFRAFLVEQRRGDEFVVFPKEGVLVPEVNRQEGQNVIVVGYRAREYGKVGMGMLVIECSDVSWTFDLRGVPPASTSHRATPILPSRAASSLRQQAPAYKASTVLRAQFPTSSMPRRNFIRENSVNPVVARATAVELGKDTRVGPSRSEAIITSAGM